jgi:AraC family transcriptional regulator
MIPSIRTLTSKKLVGKRLTMSLITNTTHQLWKNFMPLRNTILNVIGTDRYSLQIYPDNYFDGFNPATEFEKWAAVEVSSFDAVPEGMETVIIPGGLYAVFYYKGNPASGAEFFKEIFSVWLPQSGYVLDSRPHFEVLGSKYQNGSDYSEEEIWIPVTPSVI